MLSSATGPSAVHVVYEPARNVNRVWFVASIVCLRFLAESFCADGRGFSHRSSEASRRETLTGSLPVCMIRGKNEGKRHGPAMPFNCGDRTDLVNQVALNLGGIPYDLSRATGASWSAGAVQGLRMEE
jgi:hypothetical protein